MNCETIHSLIDDYAKEWMPPFETPKHIYVPIEEMSGHWYLMDASIPDQMLYYMDPYFEKQNVIIRQEKIKGLWEVITKVMQSHYFPENYLYHALCPDNWDLSEPIRLVTSTYCQHSVVWVLEWLSMEYYFQSNVHVMGDEDNIRMRVAMDLLLG